MTEVICATAFALIPFPSLSLTTMTTLQQDAVSPSATTPPPDAALPQIKQETTSRPAARMPPSLNQLAARISASGTTVTPPAGQSASRPRLAAQLLRTGSQVSLTSNAASNADSIAVNPASSTRSASPANSDRASSPLSTVPTGGEPLTTDKVEKHNAEQEKKAPIGYKNIPSLGDLPSRLEFVRLGSWANNVLSIGDRHIRTAVGELGHDELVRVGRVLRLHGDGVGTTHSSRMRREH